MCERVPCSGGRRLNFLPLFSPSSFLPRPPPKMIVPCPTRSAEEEEEGPTSLPVRPSCLSLSHSPPILGAFLRHSSSSRDGNISRRRRRRRRGRRRRRRQSQSVSPPRAWTMAATTKVSFSHMHKDKTKRGGGGGGSFGPRRPRLSGCCPIRTLSFVALPLLPPRADVGLAVRLTGTAAVDDVALIFHFAPNDSRTSIKQGPDQEEDEFTFFYMANFRPSPVRVRLRLSLPAATSRRRGTCGRREGNRNVSPLASPPPFTSTFFLR